MRTRAFNGTGLLLLGLGIAIGVFLGSAPRSEAQSATSPGGEATRQWRYSIGVSDNCSILLDTQTGETWRLMAAGGLDPRKQEWVRVPRQEDEPPRPIGIKR
ncbi:MAG: hypothetical protein GXY44_15765 [Phycisphaerales bacterium]|nr:hypothetical protein [Phycisphaerales bacterium]